MPQQFSSAFTSPNLPDHSQNKEQSDEELLAEFFSDKKRLSQMDTEIQNLMSQREQLKERLTNSLQRVNQALRESIGVLHVDAGGEAIKSIRTRLKPEEIEQHLGALLQLMMAQTEPLTIQQIYSKMPGSNGTLPFEKFKGIFLKARDESEGFIIVDPHGDKRGAGVKYIFRGTKDDQKGNQKPSVRKR